MAKIIRLTEDKFNNIIRSIIRESDEELLLQSIAQSIVTQGDLDVTVGKNDGEFKLQGGDFAYITFDVLCDPYKRRGMRGADRDVQDDYDEIIDTPSVRVETIDYCHNDGECIKINDNGLVEKALEKVINVDYSGNDIPYEEDYI